MKEVPESSTISSKPLTARQELAIQALLTTPTQEAAAKMAGISTVTLWRFMKQAEFRHAYQEARREVVGQAVNRVQRSGVTAVETLHAIAIDTSAAPTARVNAAKALLEIGLRSIQGDDLNARLDALEEIQRDLVGSSKAER